MTSSSTLGPQRIGLRLLLDQLALKAAGAAIARLERAWDGLSNEEDIEAVHRIRTGLNRMRSLIRLVGPVCRWPNPVASERTLRRWQRELGPLRDLDVLILHLTDLLGSLDRTPRRDAQRLLSHLRSRRKRLYARALQSSDRKKGRQAREALAALKRVLRDRRLALRRELAGFLPLRPAKSAQSASLLWPEVYRRWDSRKRSAEQAFHGPVLHRFRLANKRLRHVLQLFKPVAPSRWKPLYGLVDDLHESLGHLHDYEVLIGEAETLAARWHATSGRSTRRIPEGTQRLLAALDVQRRRIFDHVLDLWNQLHAPRIREVLARPLPPSRPRKPAPPLPGSVDADLPAADTGAAASQTPDEPPAVASDPEVP